MPLLNSCINILAPGIRLRVEKINKFCKQWRIIVYKTYYTRRLLMKEELLIFKESFCALTNLLSNSFKSTF